MKAQPTTQDASVQTSPETKSDAQTETDDTKIVHSKPENLPENSEVETLKH